MREEPKKKLKKEIWRNQFLTPFSLQKYGISGSQSSSYFAFAVGCYAEQPRYFEFADDPAVRHPAEVLVFGSSGGGRLASPAALGVIFVLSLLHYFNF